MKLGGVSPHPTLNIRTKKRELAHTSSNSGDAKAKPQQLLILHRIANTWHENLRSRNVFKQNTRCRLPRMEMWANPHYNIPNAPLTPKSSQNAHVTCNYEIFPSCSLWATRCICQ